VGTKVSVPQAHQHKAANAAGNTPSRQRMNRFTGAKPKASPPGGRKEKGQDNAWPLSRE